MLSAVASCTHRTVEKWSSGRTRHTFLADGVISIMVSTENTSLKSLIEIFGHKTVDTLTTIPISPHRTVTTTIYQDLSPRTFHTLSNRIIPKRIMRTHTAPLPIEIRRTDGAIDTLMKGNIIDPIPPTELTGQSVKIKIFGEETRYTL